MNITTQSCVELLNKQPKWFFQREDINAKLSCLHSLRESGAPSDIYWLLKLIRHKNKLLATTTAGTIGYLFSKLKSVNDYRDALRHTSIGLEDIDYYRQHLSTHDCNTLLAIATLNDNGYVREKAVIHLGQSQDGAKLQFLLMRLNDWVVQVRKAAAGAVNNFLHEQYLPQLLRQLPMIHSLLHMQRADLRPIFERITAFIFAPENYDTVQRIIKELDEKTRYQYFKYLLGNYQVDEQQLATIARDKYFLIRLEILKRLHGYSPGLQYKLASLFFRDKSAAVRLAAMLKILPGHESRGQILNNFLADGSGAIRDMSRRMLRDQRDSDFAKVYRNQLLANKYAKGSLLGLFETGDAHDMPLFVANLQNEKSEIIIGALHAINRIDENRAKGFAQDLIKHPVKKVRSTAAEIIARQVDEVMLQQIRMIFSAGDMEVKKSVLSLYHKIGGWKIIGDLLLAAADAETMVQDMAWDMLEKWKLNAVRLFIAPSAVERQRAYESYKVLQQSKWGVTPYRNRLLEDLLFSLR